ncbi:MAG: hypothetical protein Q8M98_00895 [Candidatus Cloacimonadaceae bacterium]|nr:hypothetical protein [Candidatus Cloacimonadaceae bacterium]MDP3113306.1 hypothetical protein [Candidatus Cloacimonadaceae bacterium]
MHDWVKEFPGAITTCDRDAIVREMNDKATSVFVKDGGEKLIGHSLYDCHNPRSIEIIKSMLETGENNIYTIEKNGKKKLIIQQPYYTEGKVAGLVELSIELPREIPHYVRT